MISIEPEQVPAYLQELLNQYGDQVDKVVKESTKKLAKEIKPELKGYSRKGRQLYRTGVYQSGWARKTISKKNQFQIKTYNKKKPTLVHLLEFGHKAPMVKAKPYPHVRQTELKYLQLLMEELEKGVTK